MPTYQIIAEGHRQIVGVVSASSVRTALEQYANDIVKPGEKKMIKTKPDRLLITNERGTRRAYEVKKV